VEAFVQIRPEGLLFKAVSEKCGEAIAARVAIPVRG
jgi:hypothetical protein